MRASSGARVPLRAEVASPQAPHAIAHLYLDVLVGIIRQGRGQFYIEFKLGAGSGTDKSSIAERQQLAEGVILHVQQNRHPPDFKRDLAVLIQSLAAP